MGEEERMEGHLHVALQIVKCPRASQSLQGLEQLVDPPSAQGTQVSQTLFGQLTSRTLLPQIDKRTSLLLANIPECPAIGESLIIRRSVRRVFLSHHYTLRPRQQVDHLIPLQKRQPTDHLPDKIDNFRIIPHSLSLVDLILQRILMVLEQGMQLEQIGTDPQVILQPEVLEGDEVAIGQGLPCLHELSHLLGVKLEDALTQGQLLLAGLVLHHCDFARVEVGDETTHQAVVLVQTQAATTRIR